MFGDWESHRWPKFCSIHDNVLQPVRNPDMDWMRNLILESSQAGQEFGEATITFFDREWSATLILIADRELGYYLKYGNETQGDTW
jgi:hypothetical protein